MEDRDDPDDKLLAVNHVRSETDFRVKATFRAVADP